MNAQSFPQVSAIISSSDLRYVAQMGVNASAARICTGISMLDYDHTILSAFGLVCNDDGAARVAAQVLLLAYMKEEHFHLQAVMMEAQMKIGKLSKTGYYHIANETLGFILDVQEQPTELEKIPSKRGRARNDEAWTIAEEVFTADMTKTFAEMTEAIESKFAENNINSSCTSMLYAFEEKYGVTLVRGKRGRARNDAAWAIAEETFNAAYAQNSEIMCNDMVEIIEMVLKQSGHEMTCMHLVLKLEEQNNIKLGRGKRGRKAQTAQLA